MAKETGTILGEISEDEAHAGRPMLSSVVVQTGSHKPGSGYFDLARLLGKLQPKQDETAFWQKELLATYDKWKRR